MIPAPSPPPPFGLIVSGRPVTTEFTFDGDRRFLTQLEAPGLIGELALFLLPGAMLGPDVGITVYSSFPPFESWEVVGVLTADVPRYHTRAAT